MAAPRHWAQRVNQSKAKGLAAGFRSGLEGKNAKHLEDHGKPVIYEQIKVRYVVPLSWHTYTPDFLLDNGIIVETKGIWTAQDRAKMLLIKTQYPELDIRMVFSKASAPVCPGVKTTCAEWATKHGFLFAEKLIPVEWMNEPGPARRPHEVLREGPKGY